MYSFRVKDSLDKIFLKLVKRDGVMMKIIDRKIGEIVLNSNHYKNLRKPLSHLKRVYIGKSHVLCFSVDEIRKVVVFEGLDHHDRIYK